ncbi:S4 domain-containing protein [Heracleum sosnowskyi]|uniref:S4 domain-containing protein n=1 Tax=Heracleum sosnowskyi TaxID=360622 RepID=A0AAD8IN84_9APIA|nr:S4 domain-containing protein [Heracleum sosnowskyi]
MVSLSSSSFSLFPRNPRYTTITNSRVSWLLVRSCSNSTAAADANSERRNNYAGVQLEESVCQVNSSKLRLDTWISSRINGISRARVQSTIKSGLVTVNGRTIHKVSHKVRSGDKVSCTISELQPLKAEPEDIPLNIVYEDDHVLVVNKPAHMVVHPAPGNATGTLVNGILHHCCLPMASLPIVDIPSDEEDISEDESSCYSADDSYSEGLLSGLNDASIRPGIVHRLDKGTSGLLVVAKDEHSHAHLSEQFKQHTIQRVYVSLTCGVPSPASGRVDIPIGRYLNNRIRMAAVVGSSKCGKTRHAASRQTDSAIALFDKIIDQSLSPDQVNYTALIVIIFLVTVKKGNGILPCYNFKIMEANACMPSTETYKSEKMKEEPARDGETEPMAKNSNLEVRVDAIVLNLSENCRQVKQALYHALPMN